MKDYESVISQAFKNLGEFIELLPDVNSVVDASLPEVAKKTIKWYPSYLAKSKKSFYMFRPFDSESFLDVGEMQEECQNAKHLVDCLVKSDIEAKVFFLTNTIEDVEALEKLNLSDDFGILHNELEKPLLDFTIRNTFNLKCKLLSNALEYLSDCKNLKGKIADEIRRFCGTYLSRKPKEAEELQMIKEFIDKMLKCDERFELSSDPIDFMASIEKTISLAKGNIRDHYFHTLNTMMMGFMILDKFYDKFDKLIDNYGDDIVPEFVWILTALYHDVGHSASQQQQLTCASLQLDSEAEVALVRTCMQETRNKIWASGKYSFVIEVLDNLFSHIADDREDEWQFDGFPRESEDSIFKRGLKDAFVEEGAHGVISALGLGLFVNPNIKKFKISQDRKFLYRHILIASLSILFHDAKVRNCFRKFSLDQIQAAKFPLSLLLTYTDILQDDRRDMTGTSARPDIFKNVDSKNGDILIVLEEKAVSQGLRIKLHQELVEALTFFIMNGITFLIPAELT